MARKDFDKPYVGSLDYSYGHPDHVQEGQEALEWWRMIINKIHAMIEAGELRPPYKQQFD